MHLRPAALLGALSAATPAWSQSTRKLYLAGSAGSEVAVPGMLTIDQTVEDIIRMSGKSKPKVLFLGTAFYDMPSAEEAQTIGFKQRGCTVDSLEMAIDSTTPSRSSISSKFDAADVIIIGGGDMLYGYDRWVKLGVDKLIKAAVDKGILVAGGSSGAAVLMDGGNSGALQARKFKNPPGPLIKKMTPAVNATFETHIRAPGFGILPGLLCPHYNTQNGDRAAGFTELMQRHSGEYAIGLDHWAAIKIEGDDYTIVSSSGQAGSVGPGGSFAPSGIFSKPGAWTVHSSVLSGKLNRTLIPTKGKVSSIVQPARYINMGSNMLQVARGLNPDDNKPCTSCRGGSAEPEEAKAPRLSREMLNNPAAFSEWTADELDEFAAALANERRKRARKAEQ